MTTVAKKNLQTAEELLNERLGIYESFGQPADKAYLNGCAAMLKALGIEYYICNGQFGIVGTD